MCFASLSKEQTVKQTFRNLYLLASLYNEWMLCIRAEITDAEASISMYICVLRSINTDTHHYPAPTPAKPEGVGIRHKMYAMQTCAAQNMLMERL